MRQKVRPKEIKEKEKNLCILKVSILRVLGEYLLISSLPGKALRTLIDIARHVLKAEPGELDIKRREPGILFISLPTDSLFKLAIMT